MASLLETPSLGIIEVSKVKWSPSDRWICRLASRFVMVIEEDGIRRGSARGRMGLTGLPFEPSFARRLPVPAHGIGERIK